MSAPQQQPIDPAYFGNQEEILQRISARKAELAADLLILCHHYQQQAVYDFADLTGDSLKLARHAATYTDRRWIVFCGVHFMAESADILTGPEQAVILPDLRAGCPMADMASRDQVEWAWQELTAVVGRSVVPITYVNSSALIKAFVGDHGGAVCTSSNADKVLTWALERGERVFFFPDEHLGRNTAHALGIPDDQVVLWRRDQPLGGLDKATLRRARVILWDGYCTVHMQFQPEHVTAWRAKRPDIKVIVHPECRREVVDLADSAGSTERIIQTIAAAEPGSAWAVGTEINLVERLARNHPDKEIHSLAPFQCLCSTMYRIKPGYLLWVLDNLAEGRVVNRITVPETVAASARTALERMLAI